MGHKSALTSLSLTPVLPLRLPYFHPSSISSVCLFSHVANMNLGLRVTAAYLGKSVADARLDGWEASIAASTPRTRGAAERVLEGWTACHGPVNSFIGQRCVQQRTLKSALSYLWKRCVEDIPVTPYSMIVKPRGVGKVPACVRRIFISPPPFISSSNILSFIFTFLVSLMSHTRKCGAMATRSQGFLCRLRRLSPSGPSGQLHCGWCLYG